jgi:hypothetical protein
MTDELSNKKNELISRNKGHRKRIKEKVLNHPESLFKYELIE